MITLAQAEREFKTNANSSGLQLFRMVKHDVNPEGTNVYIYARIKLTPEGQEGKVFAYEVFTPVILKAGSVLNDVTITEDTEAYPNGAKTYFGKRAWFCVSLQQAQKYFDALMTKGLAVQESEEEEEDSAPAPVKVSKPKAEVKKIPAGEFSCKEVAELNAVEYAIVSIWLRNEVQAGRIKKTRTERRATRGPETQLYSVA